MIFTLKATEYAQILYASSLYAKVHLRSHFTGLQNGFKYMYKPNISLLFYWEKIITFHYFTGKSSYDFL